MRMLARVEGMPLESLVQGVPWDWTTTAEYLDRLDGALAVNAGFMVGHWAIRRVVMGERRARRHARPRSDAMERCWPMVSTPAASGSRRRGPPPTTTPTATGAVPSRDARRAIALGESSSGHGARSSSSSR